MSHFYPTHKSSFIAAALIGILSLGIFLTACGSAPAETQPSVVTTESSFPTDPNPTIPEAQQTEPAAQTTPPDTEPLPTEPIPTEPVQTAPSILDSAAYQKLLAIPNSELFLSNEFGYNYLEIFAEWIEVQEGFMEEYPDEWHLKGYADGAAGLTCYSLLAEDNSRCYSYIQILDYDEIFPYPETGSRYFTDIPREDVEPLVYNAEDPIGVDESIKDAFVDYILYSDWFAWSVLEPEFRTEWYYEIVTISPEPEVSFEQLRLCVDVWRPGMAEDERFRCWLIYDPDWKQVSYGTEGEILTGLPSGE